MRALAAAFATVTACVVLACQSGGSASPANGPGDAGDAGAASDEASCVMASSPMELLEAGTCTCNVQAKKMNPSMTCSEMDDDSPGFCIRGASEPTLSTRLLCAVSPDGTTFVADIPLNYQAVGEGWTFTEAGGPADSAPPSASFCEALAAKLRTVENADPFSGSIPTCPSTLDDAGSAAVDGGGGG
jgi:hypothetical protein